MNLSLSARIKLQRLEGFRPKAYTPVPGDKLTIGYGFIKGVRLGDTMSRDQADVRLISELHEYELGVLSACTKPPNQNEFDALVLFCFNVGIGALRKSTVLRCHNAGDQQAAARAFGLWNKSGGVVYAGLTRRRAEESALYLTPVPVDASIPVVPEMPQSVDPETSMAASPINRAGVVAGGTTAVAAVSEVARTLADTKDSMQGLGSWLLPVLLLCVVGLIGYMCWQRVQQRAKGWA